MLTMAPPPRIAHQRGGGLRAQKWAGEVDRQHARPVFVSHFEDRLEDGDAGIVDQRVEPAEFFRDGVDGARNAGGVGDVAFNGDGDIGLAERLERALQGVAVDIEQRHPPAVGQEALGGGQPDAARGAGDEGYFRCRLAHAAAPQTIMRRYGSMTAGP